MTSGAIYPGVPDVSAALSGDHILEIPISVTLTYPSSPINRFSGLMSLWMTPYMCMYSRPAKQQAMMNLD